MNWTFYCVDHPVGYTWLIFLKKPVLNSKILRKTYKEHSYTQILLKSNLNSESLSNLPTLTLLDSSKYCPSVLPLVVDIFLESSSVHNMKNFVWLLYFLERENLHKSLKSWLGVYDKYWRDTVCFKSQKFYRRQLTTGCWKNP